MSEFAVSSESGAAVVITFPQQVLGGPLAVELAGIVRDHASHGHAAVVLDLSGVEVMNSSGLGMLVSTLTSLRKQNVRLCLAAVPEKVSSLLAMTQLAQIFEIFPTVSDAVGTA